MEPLWQTVLVVAAIVVALAYLVWYQVRKRRQKSVCESCPAMLAMKESARKRRQPPSNECCESQDSKDSESSSESNKTNSR